MKVEQFLRFDEPECRRLDDLLSFPRKTFARGDTIIKEGEKVGDIHLVLTGMAARCKTLADGERQIMALLIPGDLCDVEVFVLEAMDHNITAITDTVCVLIPSKIIEALLTESSKITRGLWWSTMINSGILREWIIDHGSRNARERLAHLCYELLVRYRVVGETTDNTIPFPLTQQDLSDATGITPVHVNRMLQELRNDGLIETKDHLLSVLDLKRLKEAAQFESSYLHLVRTENGDNEIADRARDLISDDERSNRTD